MKKHRKLIKYLISEKDISLHELVSKDYLNTRQYIGSRKFINELESIIYTLDLLKKNNYIRVIRTSGTSDAGFYDGIFVNNEFKLEEVKMVHYTIEKFKKIYGEEYEINFDIYNFSKFFYLTKEEINFWLPIFVAIITAFLTALLTSLLSGENCYTSEVILHTFRFR
jgi:hypothetical protein